MSSLSSFWKRFMWPSVSICNLIFLYMPAEQSRLNAKGTVRVKSLPIYGADLQWWKIQVALGKNFLS